MVKRSTFYVTVLANATARVNSTNIIKPNIEGYVVSAVAFMLQNTVAKKGDHFISTGITTQPLGTTANYNNDICYFFAGYNYGGEPQTWMGRFPIKPEDYFFINLRTRAAAPTQARANFTVEQTPSTSRWGW